MSSSNEKSNLGIHFFYVATILISIIILLATAKWTELAKFTDYLSAAATIASLVLALLAIIYSYISNDSLSRTTGMVAEAAMDAHEATTKISSLLNSVESLSEETNNSNELLSTVLEDFKKQIQSLGETASTLDIQANAIAAALPEIPKGLDQLGKRFDEFVQATPPNPELLNNLQEQTDTQPLDITKINLLASSPAGVLLMYACYLSQKSGKSFDVEKFASGFTTSDYMYGYYVALTSLGIVELEKIDGSNTVTKVTQCPAIFSESRNIFMEKLVNQPTETQVIWLKHLQDVAKLFES